MIKVYWVFMIPYGKQNISQDDIEAVIRVLKSDFITQGPVVPAFENALAAYCGAAHCTAVNSATSGLHIALLSLDVGPGDLVWTSPVTFVASSNAALYCGADVDFVDINRQSMNLDMDVLEERLEIAEKAGRLPKVIIPVHLCGRSCDMKRLAALRDRFGFKIIEDAAHAVGGSYLGKPVGSCFYSDLTVFSFHPVKIITTAEGGAVMTNDRRLSQRLASLRSHGITRDPDVMEQSDGPWYYEQHALGYNYRMTEMQAALGLSQLDRLDVFINSRQRHARRYQALLENSTLTLPVQDTDENQSAWHLYVVRLSDDCGPLERRRLYEKLQMSGISPNVHYIPVYRQPYYKKMGFVCSSYPESEHYYERAISIPLFYDLTEDQQDTIVNSLISPSGYQTIF